MGGNYEGDWCGYNDGMRDLSLGCRLSTIYTLGNFTVYFMLNSMESRFKQEGTVGCQFEIDLFLSLYKTILMTCIRSVGCSVSGGRTRDCVESY